VIDLQPTDSDVAIIGLSCRFPGAQDAETFWRNLQAGVESIARFQNTDLLNAGVPPQVFNQPHYVNASGDLTGIEEFDAAFFDYSAREAALIDPQQRLFLEHAWEAVEHAGYDALTYAGAIGVFAGAGVNSYLLNNLYATLDPAQLASLFQTILANDKDFLAPRVSYHLNLKGPSITVQTACSTSLVAIHLASQSLLNGECDLALAGGVTVRVPQSTGYLYQTGLILSPDGHCRAFDANAQGTVGGNGVGVVVLKRLPDALADGDTIHAVIKGSAVNNDGAEKVGYTAPSIDGQAAVIQEAQAIAGVTADSITYLEAHGTGTPLGDPIEIAALQQAFQSPTQQPHYCALGSVKTNVGHLDTAAGVAGLIKTVLALNHQQIPPSLHIEQLNPDIAWTDSPFYVNTQLQEWTRNGTPRRAGVSSFGIGGTNAHVILEEAPVVQPPGTSRSWQVLMVSAKTPTALKTRMSQLADHLQRHPHLNLADVAYTLHVGRHAFGYRQAVVCRDTEAAIAALQAPDLTLNPPSDARDHPPVAFLFPGLSQGDICIPRDLYAAEPMFRDAVSRCCQQFQSFLSFDLRDNLDPYSEPALFVIEYALAQLWQAWGLRPVAMVGDGVGEYVAATLAGVLSLEDAIAIVAKRAQMLQKAPEMTVPSLALTESFTQFVNTIALHPPQIPYISTISGTWITAADATDPDYWTRHLHQSACFTQGIHAVQQQYNPVFLYVGLHSVADHWSTCLTATPARSVVLPTPPAIQQPDPYLGVLLNLLGQVWTAGVAIEGSGFYAHEQRHRVPLPTYPFERQRYWIEPPASVAAFSSPGLNALHQWEAIVGAGYLQATQERPGFDESVYRDNKQQLDQLCLAYILQAFRDLGVFSQPQQRYGIDDVLQQAQVMPRYHQLCDRWLDLLVNHGYLQRDPEGQYTNLSAVLHPTPELLADVKRCWADEAQLIEQIELYGKNMAAILRGNQEPLELRSACFQGDAFVIPETPALAYHKAIVQRVCKQIVQGYPSHQPLRVLEIGGGAGIATAELLPVLPAQHTEYTFTDVGSLFLRIAQQKFRAYPFVQYRLLDMEQPLQAQGYAHHAYDVVVAYNVLHVSPNLDSVLDRVRSLLVPGGFLLLWELTQPQLAFDIADAPLMYPVEAAWGRSMGNPFLSKAQWQAALHTHGFSQVAAFSEVAVWGQHVFVAQATQSDNAALLPSTANGNELAQSPTPQGISPPSDSGLCHPRPNLKTPYVAAETDLERRLAGIFQALLGFEPVGLHDSFFDLGGDSLTGTVLVSRLRDAFQLELAIRTIFEAPTIAQLAVAIEDLLIQELEALPDDPVPAPTDPTDLRTTAKPNPSLVN
jgi:acyl transferase domain-containing protein/SAM-dependent methyltransferase/acyl carrier protein